MPSAYSGIVPTLSALAIAAAVVAFSTRGAKPLPVGENAAATMLAEPAPVGVAAATDTAVFAGGCFWGVEAVFERLAGVKDVVSGFAGGARAASYEVVSTGTTGHAEVVKITYDPARISYGTLLKVFFAVAHDPTQLNRQGPDEGPQYRSSIFYGNADQQRVAAAYIAQMRAAGTYGKAPIVTQLQPLKAFHPAEAYHQDYAVHQSDQPYIVLHDLPKVENLRKRLPELYVVK